MARVGLARARAARRVVGATSVSSSYGYIAASSYVREVQKEALGSLFDHFVRSYLQS